ncbi:hypothetical protein [Cystobacter ferrugineus]|uniref:hypothetical protein n=1 Tax=Cystobacter ferrugineus TaxID=83449 RepID=UPI000B0401C6|nr:hypothetical protein [Cystobacter ferrugineus]
MAADALTKYFTFLNEGTSAKWPFDKPHYLLQGLHEHPAGEVPGRDLAPPGGRHVGELPHVRAPGDLEHRFRAKVSTDSGAR